MANIVYKIKNWNGQVTISRMENGAESFVPEAPGNRHYEEYLEWVAEGNTAEVIEEEA